jgi:signal transduction histidine kinase
MNTIKSKKTNKAAQSLVNNILSRGGEMGRLIQAKDWSKTPLGPLESWPQSLKTAMCIMLMSRYPMFIWWGETLTKLYNDSYIPMLGNKHPAALGQSATFVWAEIWPELTPRVETVMKKHESTFDEGLFLLFKRYGYMEETYFTFSYSPIQNDDAEVAGLFCACHEQTKQIIGDRQLSFLRKMAIETAGAHSFEQSCAINMKCMQSNLRDIPFSIMYLLDASKSSFHLIGVSGIDSTFPACAEVITRDSNTPWPLWEVIAEDHARLIENLSSIFERLPTGDWDLPPSKAFVMPIGQYKTTEKTLVMIAALNPYRPFDEDYQRFMELIAAQLSASFSNATVYEEERKRLEALAQLDAAKTLFLSNISHEFRTPLTLILGPVEEALQDKNSPAQIDRLNIICRNALRLLKMVNMLLDFSRIEAGHENASFSPIDLACFTADLASMFRSIIEKAGVKYIVHCDPLPEPVYVDTEMWEKIVLNLLSNAFKHTFQGEIEISLQWKDTHVELSVRDSGVGIPPDQLPKLFDRFYRVSHAKSRTHEGSGIGLSLALELVKLHKGQMTVDSIVEKSTTFTVSIPTGKAHLPTKQINFESKFMPTVMSAQPYLQEALHWVSHVDHPPQTLVKDKRFHILIVDDNQDMRAYMLAILTPYYYVETASDGINALLAIKRSRPDLILSDIMMPNMNGIELLKALRNERSLQSIPVIFLSARAGEEAKIEGLEAGVDDYLVKPFSSRALLAKIKTHLDMTRIRHEEMIKQLEDEVKKQTRQLELTNKELESFAYSVSHDLRAPIRTMDGFSQLLLKRYLNKLDEEGQNFLQRIHDGCQKMYRLIDDLLMLSKINQCLLNTEKEVDLSAIAQNIMHDLQSRDQNRTVICHIDEGIVAQGDPLLLEDLLQNLLGNAWKYTSKHAIAHIEFSKFQHENVTIYYVKDDGAGFNMAYSDKLFEAFQRLHNETEFPGEGIGLATVKRIVERHGGRVWAKGAIEKGATFYFTLEPFLFSQGHNDTFAD